MSRKRGARHAASGPSNSIPRLDMNSVTLEVGLFSYSPTYLCFVMFHPAITLWLRLHLVPFLPLPSHHNQRRTDRLTRSAGMHPSAARVLDSTVEFLRPFYPGRGPHQGLAERDLSGSAWRKREAGGETGISVGVSGGSPMVDSKASLKEGDPLGESQERRHPRSRMRLLARGLSRRIGLSLDGWH